MLQVHTVKIVLQFWGCLLLPLKECYTNNSPRGYINSVEDNTVVVFSVLMILRTLNQLQINRNLS